MKRRKSQPVVDVDGLLDEARRDPGVAKVTLDFGEASVTALLWTASNECEYAVRETPVEALVAALAKLRNYLAESAS